MPFYEYHCSSCKRTSEVMQKISDPPLKKCPSCGRSTLTKLISAPVFRLKGGGWYETDFKSDTENKRNLAGEGSQEEVKTEAKTQTPDGDKVDSKPPAEEKTPAAKKTTPKSVASPKPPRKPAGRAKAKRKKAG